MKSNINPEYLIQVRRQYGAWIREFREQKGLTQQELADKIGFKQSTISKIEQGRWNFTVDILTVFAVNLDFYLFLIEKDSDDELVKLMRERLERSHQNN